MFCNVTYCSASHFFQFCIMQEYSFGIKIFQMIMLTVFIVHFTYLHTYVYCDVTSECLVYNDIDGSLTTCSYGGATCFTQLL